MIGLTHRDKNKAVSEYFRIIDKCTQISYDDRSMLRDHAKLYNPQLLYIFREYARDKCFSTLQVNLRKYIQQVRRNKEKGYKNFGRKQGEDVGYSQFSLPNSCRNSLKNSVEKNSSKQKIITIDISEFRKSVEKGQGKKLSITASTPKLKINKQNYPPLVISKKEQPVRKSSANVQKQPQRQVFIEAIQTLPEMKTFSNSEEKITPFDRSPKPSFLKEICHTQEIQTLMRSKLKKSGNSKKNNLFIETQQSNKENTDTFNRVQANYSPSFLTDRYAVTSRTTDREKEDPMFGQFHKKIKDIMKNDMY